MKTTGYLLSLVFGFSGLFVSSAWADETAKCEQLSGREATQKLKQIEGDLKQFESIGDGSSERDVYMRMYKPAQPDEFFDAQSAIAKLDFTDRQMPRISRFWERISGSDLATANTAAGEYGKALNSTFTGIKAEIENLEAKIKTPGTSDDIARAALARLYAVKRAQSQMLRKIQAEHKVRMLDPNLTCTGYSFYSKTAWDGKNENEDIRYWQCSDLSKDLLAKIPKRKEDPKRCYYDLTCRRAKMSGATVQLQGVAMTVSCEKTADGCPKAQDCAGQSTTAQVTNLEKGAGAK